MTKFITFEKSLTRARKKQHNEIVHGKEETTQWNSPLQKHQRIGNEYRYSTFALKKKQYIHM